MVCPKPQDTKAGALGQKSQTPPSKSRIASILLSPLDSPQASKMALAWRHSGSRRREKPRRRSSFNMIKTWREMPKTSWRRQRSKIFCNTLLYNSKGSMTHTKNHTHRKQLCACVSETTLVGQLVSRCRKSQEGEKSHPRRKVCLNPKVGTGPQGQTVALVLMSVAVCSVLFSF